MIPTQPPTDDEAVMLTYDKALKRALREPANHLQQLENLARGALRFSTAWLVHTLANACLLVLFIMAVSPAETVGLWEAAHTAALDAAKVRVIAIGEGETHVTLGAAPGDRPLPHYTAQAQSVREAASREPTGVRDVTPAVSEPATYLEVQPSHPRRAEVEARELLSEILKVAMLLAALVGLFANTGGFTNVYAKVARERVQRAESLMREQALQEALANRVTVAVLAVLRKDREA